MAANETAVRGAGEGAARPGGRADGELRAVRFEPDVAPAAAGSVLAVVGATRVLCAATVEEAVPRWMRQQRAEGGWLTAEYSLLPYSTRERTSRESTAGKVGGRTHEIQRMIGRSLRAVMDLGRLGARTVWVDCDVLQADGGTRTAALTGGWLAVRMAVRRLQAQGVLTADPVREALAAVSVGMVGGRPRLDLCYEEDFAAEVDMNVVMTSSGRFIEVQGSAEKEPFRADALQQMLDLARGGIAQLLEAQEAALAVWSPRP